MKTKYDELTFLENRLMQMYLQAISNAVPEIGKEEKTLVQNTINTIKERVPLEKYVNTNVRQYDHVIGHIKNAAFNGKEATHTRIDAGYKSIASLIREIFDNNNTREQRSAYQSIRTFELGDHRPRNPPKQGSTTEKYLSWLKDQGYNPFNLEDK